MYKKLLKENYSSLNKEGISLIVLIITIVVIIVLAGTIILSLTNNNPFENAKEAKFKEDLANFRDDLTLTISKEFLDTLGDREKINATSFEDIKNYIPNFTGSYVGKIIIKEDKLAYVTNSNTSKEIVWLQSIDIPDENSIVISDNTTDNSSNELVNSPILEFTPIIEEINGNYITVKGNAISNTTTIIGYEYFLNGQYIDLTKNSSYSILNLEPDTEYAIQVMAIDNEGNVRKSNVIQQKTDNKLYLYKYGNEFTLITGGWNVTGYHVSLSGSLTKYSNYMNFYTPSNSRIYIGTKNMIDLSKYSTIVIKYNGNLVSSGVANVFSNKSYYSNQDTSTPTVYSTNFASRDISNLNVNCYIHLSIVNLSINVDEIYLEL